MLARSATDGQPIPRGVRIYVDSITAYQHRNAVGVDAPTEMRGGVLALYPPIPQLIAKPQPSCRP
jgi:hypothetical protein